MSAFLTLVGTSARLAFGGSNGGALVSLVFFLAVITVVPFAVGPDMNLLSRIGPAVLWVGALLASLLVLDRLF
ncbi:MAG: heme exporter protein CcmB, partial [Alphaproteobacteria bacterium]